MRLAAVDLPAAGPLVDGVIGFDAVGTVEAGAGLAVLGQVVVSIEEDEGVQGGVFARLVADSLALSLLRSDVLGSGPWVKR